MKTDIYTKSILTVIAFGLLLIGMKTIISTSVAEVQSPRYGITSSCYTYDDEPKCWVWVLNQNTGEIQLWRSSRALWQKAEYRNKWSVMDDAVTQ